MAFRQKQIKNLVAADLTALTALTMDGKEVVYVESENSFWTKIAGVNTLIGNILTNQAITGVFTVIADSVVTTSVTIPVSPNIPTGTSSSRIEIYHNGIKLRLGSRYTYVSNSTTQVVIDVLATNAFPLNIGDELECIIK